MVVRIELDDPNIGWTQYGPSEYIPEKMKEWLVKYVWNRDKLSKYERAESLYIVGPSKIGKTDTCYNLLNKNGQHCKVFVIDTYTNWQAFHNYIEENGLPDFVLVDDISIEEMGREWKNLLGAQKTITYALNSTKNSPQRMADRVSIYATQIQMFSTTMSSVHPKDRGWKTIYSEANPSIWSGILSMGRV
jgi:hypothetical protein